jgi:hypothetical protein
MDNDNEIIGEIEEKIDDALGEIDEVITETVVEEI